MLRCLKLFGCVLVATASMSGAECTPAAISPQERLARFQEIDAAAQKAFDGGRFAEAAAGYREAACLAPKSARAFFGLGGSEAALGNYEAAAHAFEMAAEILPGNAMPLVMLVRVHVTRQDIES